MSNPIGYSPSDFFYVSALANNNSQDIDPNFCNNIRNTEFSIIDASCNSLIYNENPIDISFCTKAAICQNQDLANKWSDLQTNHSGSERKLEDVQMSWYVTRANSVNLIVGIGLISWLCSKSIYEILRNED